MEHLVQADAEIARRRFRAALEHLAELQPRQRSRHYLPYNLPTAEAQQLARQNDRSPSSPRRRDHTSITNPNLDPYKPNAA